MARILVVDDVKFISQMLAGIFEGHGHLVKVATNGTEALSVARSFSPELILMDVAMPDLDGVEVARTLRSEPATNHIPIMMVTSRNDSETLVRAQQAGVDDYILKPFETPRLLEKATELLGGFPMNFDISVVENAAVVRALTPELSGTATDQLVPALEAAAGATAGSIVLDLSKVTRMEPRATSVLIDFLLAFRRSSGQLEVVRPGKEAGGRALAGRIAEHAEAHETLEAAYRAAGISPDAPAESLRLGRKASPRDAATPPEGAAPGGTAPKEKAEPAPKAARSVPTRGVVVESHAKAVIIRVTRAHLDEEFFEALAGQIAESASNNLLLEFQQLESLGSTDLWELAALAEKATAAGRSLRLVNPVPEVAASLEKANLGPLILRTKQAAS